MVGGRRPPRQVVPVAIEQWKANVIRLPVAAILVRRGDVAESKEAGLPYRKIVDKVIEAAASRGAYVAVDLHAFGAPMDETSSSGRTSPRATRTIRP